MHLAMAATGTATGISGGEPERVTDLCWICGDHEEQAASLHVLKFGIAPPIAGHSLVGRSDLCIDSRPDGSVAHASRFCNVAGAAVQITFARFGMQHGLGWWHPSPGTNRLLIGNGAS
jgi:hypothetical protein